MVGGVYSPEMHAPVVLYLPFGWNAQVMQVAEDVWVDAVSTDQALTNHTRYLNHAEGAASNCVVFGTNLIPQRGFALASCLVV